MDGDNDDACTAIHVDAAPASFGLRLCVAMAFTAIGLLLHLAPARR